MNPETAVIMWAFPLAIIQMGAIVALIQPRAWDWICDRLPEWLAGTLLAGVSLLLALPISAFICYVTGYGS